MLCFRKCVVMIAMVEMWVLFFNIRMVFSQDTVDLQIITYPLDAKVYIDNVFQGIGARTIIGVSQGPHTLKCTRDRFGSIEKDTIGNANNICQLYPLGIPNQTSGVFIDVNIPNATVYLNYITNDQDPSKKHRFEHLSTGTPFYYTSVAPNADYMIYAVVGNKTLTKSVRSQAGKVDYVLFNFSSDLTDMQKKFNDFLRIDPQQSEKLISQDNFGSLSLENFYSAELAHIKQSLYLLSLDLYDQYGNIGHPFTLLKNFSKHISYVDGTDPQFPNALAVSIPGQNTMVLYKLLFQETIGLGYSSPDNSQMLFFAANRASVLVHEALHEKLHAGHPCEGVYDFDDTGVYATEARFLAEWATNGRNPILNDCAGKHVLYNKASSIGVGRICGTEHDVIIEEEFNRPACARSAFLDGENRIIIEKFLGTTPTPPPPSTQPQQEVCTTSEYRYDYRSMPWSGSPGPGFNLSDRTVEASCPEERDYIKSFGQPTCQVRWGGAGENRVDFTGCGISANQSRSSNRKISIDFDMPSRFILSDQQVQRYLNRSSPGLTRMFDGRYVYHCSDFTTDLGDICFNGIGLSANVPEPLKCCHMRNAVTPPMHSINPNERPYSFEVEMKDERATQYRTETRRVRQGRRGRWVTITQQVVDTSGYETISRRHGFTRRSLPPTHYTFGSRILKNIAMQLLGPKTIFDQNKNAYVTYDFSDLEIEGAQRFARRLGLSIPSSFPLPIIPTRSLILPVSVKLMSCPEAQPCNIRFSLRSTELHEFLQPKNLYFSKIIYIKPDGTRMVIYEDLNPTIFKDEIDLTFQP